MVGRANYYLAHSLRICGRVAVERDDYVEVNRQMWNATAAVHEQAYVHDLRNRIQADDFTTFDAVEQKIFKQLNLQGKSVAQVCCNNGRELIAVKKAGAGRCVGFDVSDDFIQQARELTELGKVDVEFVRTNVYELPEEYFNQFDIVYITIGVFGWLPDADKFIEILVNLLKPNGHIFIYEMHPILNMFEGDQGQTFVYSYFDTEPDYVESDPDYMDSSVTIEKPSYWFSHKLSDIIGGLIKNGLYVTHFAEYDYDISNSYEALGKGDKRPPMCYSLVAQTARRG